MASYEELGTFIQEGNFVETQNQVKALLAEGKSPGELIQKGIIEALDIVGKRFSEGDCYIPEMLVSAKASQKGLEIVKPLLVQSGFQPRGKIVMGTVKGDLHDIGKNIVAMMLEGAGFRVIDLGYDVASGEIHRYSEGGEGPDFSHVLSYYNHHDLDEKHHGRAQRGRALWKSESDDRRPPDDRETLPKKSEPISEEKTPTTRLKRPGERSPEDVDFQNCI